MHEVTTVFGYYWIKLLDSQSSKKNCCLLQWKPFKNDEKNAFDIILKALFVFKIFKFLFWLFGHIEKTVWLER